MADHDALVRKLYILIDLRTWPAMADLVTIDVTYDRPGYPTINGVADFLAFYEHTRVIAGGTHHLESLLTDDKQGFCWGTFVGVSHSGATLSEPSRTGTSSTVTGFEGAARSSAGPPSDEAAFAHPLSSGRTGRPASKSSRNCLRATPPP